MSAFPFVTRYNHRRRMALLIQLIQYLLVDVWIIRIVNKYMIEVGGVDECQLN